LLQLPTELLVSICELAVNFWPKTYPENHGSWDRRTFSHVPPPLARVCRRIRAETISIYFSINYFYIQVPWHSACTVSDKLRFFRQIDAAAANGSLGHVNTLRLECGAQKRTCPCTHLQARHAHLLSNYRCTRPGGYNMVFLDVFKQSAHRKKTEPSEAWRVFDRAFDRLKMFHVNLRGSKQWALGKLDAPVRAKSLG
jgi:hypothetical protein